MKSLYYIFLMLLVISCSENISNSNTNHDDTENEGENNLTNLELFFHENLAFDCKIENIPSRKKTYYSSYSPGEGNLDSSEYDFLYRYKIDKNLKYNNDIIFNQVEKQSNNTYILKFDDYSPKDIEMIIEFDSTKSYIKYFSYRFIHSYFQYSNDTRYTFEDKFILENVPFSIIANFLGKPELIIELKGQSINQYFPFICSSYSYNDNMGHSGTNYREFIMTKKDAQTGKPINYYPTNDSSYIRFSLH